MSMNVQGIDAKQPQKHHHLRSAAIMTTGLVGGTYAGGKLCGRYAGDKLVKIVEPFVDVENGKFKLLNDKVLSMIDFEKAKASENLSQEIKENLNMLSEVCNSKIDSKASVLTGMKLGASLAAIEDSKDVLEKEGVLNAEKFQAGVKESMAVFSKAAKNVSKTVGKYVGGGLVVGGLVAYGVNKMLKAHDKKEVKA